MWVDLSRKYGNQNKEWAKKYPKINLYCAKNCNPKRSEIGHLQSWWSGNETQLGQKQNWISRNDLEFNKVMHLASK